MAIGRLVRLCLLGMLPEEGQIVSTLEVVHVCQSSFCWWNWCDCRFLLLQNNLYLSSFTSLQLGSLYKAHTNRSIFAKSSSLGRNLSPKLLTICLRAGFNCTISSAFFFPLVEKALTLSQPVMACRLGSTSRISRPSFSHTCRILTMRELLLVPLISVMSAALTAW